MPLWKWATFATELLCLRTQLVGSQLSNLSSPDDIRFFKTANTILDQASASELPFAKEALRITAKGRADALDDEECLNLARQAVRACLRSCEVMRDRWPPSSKELESKLDDLQRTLSCIGDLVEHFPQRSFCALRSYHSRSKQSKRIHELHERLLNQSDAIEAIIRAEGQSEAHNPHLDILSKRSAALVGSHHIPVLPSRPSIFYGRDRELEDIVQAILQRPINDGAHIAVLGAGGIGKSCLALAVLHNQSIAERFSTERYFVRCDAAVTADGFLGAVAKEIGLAGAQAFERTVPETLANLSPALLVLDNFETPWQQSRMEVEGILQSLAAISTLSIIVTMRGMERPLYTSWSKPPLPPLAPLDLKAACQVFADISSIHKDDVNIERLMKKVDCLPLAVTLLAHVAKVNGLPYIVDHFREQETSFINDGSGCNHRETSLEASIEVSLQSPRMKVDPSAIQFLRILALLPDGLAESDIATIAEGSHSWDDAAFTLRKTALAYHDRSQSRLRVLVPIRMYIANRYPPTTTAVKALQDHFTSLARFAKCIGTVQGLGALERVRPEIQNIQALIERALIANRGAGIWANMEWAKEAATSLTHLLWYSGLGTTHALEIAAEIACHMGRPLDQADCLSCIGFVASGRANYVLAEERYLEALMLYRTMQNIIGQAECLRGLGFVSNHTANYDTASNRFSNSLTLFRQFQDSWGIAECLKGLAVIADHSREAVESRRCYEEAILLFRSVGDITGEADCIRGLAFAELRGESLEGLGSAANGFKHAVQMFEKVGKLTGQADCLRGLGLVELARRNWESATTSLAQALDLYASAGNSWKLAQCLKGLGDADVGSGTGRESCAIERYVEAARLFAQVGNKEDEAACLSALYAVQKGLPLLELLSETGVDPVTDRLS